MWRAASRKMRRDSTTYCPGVAARPEHPPAQPHQCHLGHAPSPADGHAGARTSGAEHPVVHAAGAWRMRGHSAANSGVTGDLLPGFLRHAANLHTTIALGSAPKQEYCDTNVGVQCNTLADCRAWNTAMPGNASHTGSCPEIELHVAPCIFCSLGWQIWKDLFAHFHKKVEKFLGLHLHAVHAKEILHVTQCR